MNEDRPNGKTFLSLESKISQSTVKSRLDALREGGHPGPVVVELDMTSFCDFECPECISADVLGTTRFTRDRLVELCEQMHVAGVKSVILTGGGEPLRHHAAPDVIRALSDREIGVGLITNGYGLAALPADLLRQLKWIRVSLDAGTPSTYTTFRPHPERERAFARVLAGIEHAIGSGCERVGISYVLLCREGESIDNFGEIAIAAKLAQGLGASYLNVKAMQNPDHTVYRYSNSQIARIRTGLAEAREYQASDFELISSSNLEAVLLEQGYQEKSYARCLSISLRALITPDGMFPCAYHRGNPAMRYPTQPAHDSFQEMWASASSVQVSPGVDCRFHCARHESNVELERVYSLPTPLAEEGDFDWDLFI